MKHIQLNVIYLDLAGAYMHSDVISAASTISQLIQADERGLVNVTHHCTHITLNNHCSAHGFGSRNMLISPLDLVSGTSEMGRITLSFDGTSVRSHITKEWLSYNSSPTGLICQYTA